MSSRPRSLLVVLALAVVACGIPGRGSGDRTPEGDAPPPFGVPASPVLVLDAEHWYRIVNLQQSRTPLDVYPYPGEPRPGIPPVVAGLAYGRATESLSPGGVKTTGPPADYGMEILPTGTTELRAARFQFALRDSTGGKPWKHGIAVLTGTGNQLSVATYYDGPGASTNPVPDATPGKVTLLVDATGAGDTNVLSTNRLLAGTAAGCLKATNDTGGQPGATAILGGSHFIVVEPGTASIGFWRTTRGDYSGATCTGTPAFSVSLPALAAGSRTALFVYGLDTDHLGGLLIPIDS